MQKAPWYDEIQDMRSPCTWLTYHHSIYAIHEDRKAAVFQASTSDACGTVYCYSRGVNKKVIVPYQYVLWRCLSVVSIVIHSVRYE